MKTLQEIEEIIRGHRQELEQKFGLRGIGIFGSYVRGEQNEDSDLDVLVELERPAGLVKFMKLENYLSHILGIRVELVTRKALKPHIGREILKEVQYV